MEVIENQGEMEMVMMDVCLTEDAVGVFMDYFLQPLLPMKSTKQHTPTLAQQEAVAKQAHAVVILYNYFHRKKHPELEFLDFISICELMIILKPQMLAYMKFMQLSKDGESKDTGVEKQFSVTEKSIREACSICEQLDQVQGLPTLEALKVCKVAIMLVDALGESCYLQFSSITKGAWSLVEKEVDPVTLTGNDIEKSQQPKGVYSRKKVTKKPMSYMEGQFQKIAISAITETTGINHANLRVMESHLVYSLDKENTAVRFFIVKCTKSFSEDVTPISIKFVVDSLQGSLVKKDCIWSVTEAAEYFHMFPYAAIISKWLSRDVTLDDVQDAISDSGVPNADESHVSRESSKTPAADEYDGPTSASSSAVQVGTKVKTSNVFQKESRGACKSSMHKTTMVLDNMDHYDFLESTKEKNRPDIHTAKQQQIGKHFCTSREKNGNSLQSNIIGAKVVIENTRNDDVIAYNHCTPRKESSAISQPSEPKYLLHDVASSGNILTLSALKVMLRKREKLSQQRREIEDEIAQCDKTILAILTGREDGLAAKLESLMEACNDMNLSSPVPVGIRNGVLPRQDNQASVTPWPAKRKRATDVCKELDETCHGKNWGMPNYRISQSRGGFQGVVTVEREGIEVSENGETYSNVFEARESAAKHMLDKLRSI